MQRILLAILSCLFMSACVLDGSSDILNSEVDIDIGSGTRGIVLQKAPDPAYENAAWMGVFAGSKLIRRTGHATYLVTAAKDGKEEYTLRLLAPLQGNSEWLVAEVTTPTTAAGTASYMPLRHADGTFTILPWSPKLLAAWQPDDDFGRELLARMKAAGMDGEKFVATTPQHLADLLHVSSRFDPRYRIEYRIGQRSSPGQAQPGNWQIESSEDVITKKKTAYARLEAARTEPGGRMFFQFECNGSEMNAWFSTPGKGLRPVVRDAEVPAVALDMRFNDSQVITMLWVQRGKADEFSQPNPFEAMGLGLIKGFSPRLKEAATGWKANDFRKLLTSANALVVRVRTAGGGDLVGHFVPRAPDMLAAHLRSCAK
ncbi:MAG: hypothetical protein KDE03_04585 [Rhodobacteraceae bacterium]|nr:hypothetical protein [Paracoccaceae bacterium]